MSVSWRTKRVTISYEKGVVKADNARSGRKLTEGAASFVYVYVCVGSCGVARAPRETRSQTAQLPADSNLGQLETVAAEVSANAVEHMVGRRSEA